MSSKQTATTTGKVAAAAIGASVLYLNSLKQGIEKQSKENKGADDMAKTKKIATKTKKDIVVSRHNSNSQKRTGFLSCLEVHRFFFNSPETVLLPRYVASFVPKLGA